MNDIDVSINTADAEEEKDLESIEIDGESFQIEEFEPTAEEYRELVGGVYKSFYDDDLKSAVDKAIADNRDAIRAELEAEIRDREAQIRDEAKKELLQKISKRRMRPDENGISVQHKSPSRDVSKMTKEERAEAARRAAGGLIINLK